LNHQHLDPVGLPFNEALPSVNGAQYMLLSAFGFSVMGALVKVAGGADVPLLQIIAVRAAISIVLSLADIRRAGRHPLGHRRGWLFARGAVGFLSLTCVYYAVLHLPYAQATVLQYLHPVFTAALAYLILREVPSIPTLVCVMLSLLGLLVMLMPAAGADSMGSNWLAMLAGLAGALGSGLAYTIVRKLAPTEHPSVIVLYFPMVCLPAAILIGWDTFIWPTGHTWIVLLGVGLFTQVGQIGLTKAMQTDLASRATSLSYIQIVFAAILGLAFFGEIPHLNTLIGAGLIITGAIVSSWLHGRRPARDVLSDT